MMMTLDEFRNCFKSLSFHANVTAAPHPHISNYMHGLTTRVRNKTIKKGTAAADKQQRLGCHNKFPCSVDKLSEMTMIQAHTKKKVLDES
jgi:hypothetical protein